MKKQQRLSSEKSDTNYYSPLNNLKDAQVLNNGSVSSVLYFALMWLG